MPVIDTIEFSKASHLYKYLRETGVMKDLYLFRNTSLTDIPNGNIGYTLMVDGEVAGAAILYDEQDGGWLNEMFEILPKFRGQHLTRPFYETIKEDLCADLIHGFATNDETQRLWEHLGQVCIDPECREMIDLLDGRTIEEYLIDERPELLSKWKETTQEKSLEGQS